MLCLLSIKVLCEFLSNPLLKQCFKKNLKNSIIWKNIVPKRQFSTNLRLNYNRSMKAPIIVTKGTLRTGGALTKQQVEEIVEKLNNYEKSLFYTVLEEHKVKYLGEKENEDSNEKHWPLPEDWFHQTFTGPALRPRNRDLFGVCIANSIPFIGFGFLDNFIMITAEDYINKTLGSVLCLSTILAAALGNTLSGAIGIGCAFYVERIAFLIGYKPPKLTASQLELPVAKRFAHMGRVFGIIVGCILGMFPLLFMPPREEKRKQVKS